jgi:hypothetical protein
MGWIAAVFCWRQTRAHELARSVEGVVVATRGGSVLHGGSLYWHCGFSLSIAGTRAAKKPLERRMDASDLCVHLREAW